MAIAAGPLYKPPLSIRGSIIRTSANEGSPASSRLPSPPVGERGLAVTGFYAKQHMYERAYGNYLGLCRLGHFMAHEMGLTLSKVVCIATPAARDRSKRDLAGLARQVKSALLDFQDEEDADSQEKRHA